MWFEERISRDSLTQLLDSSLYFQMHAQKFYIQRGCTVLENIVSSIRVHPFRAAPSFQQNVLIVRVEGYYCLFELF